MVERRSCWLVLAAVVALTGCDDSRPELQGHWDLVISISDAMGDTVVVERGSAGLAFGADGSFAAQRRQESVTGTYTLERRDEPGFGGVQIVELSSEVAFLGHGSEYIVEVQGDTLHLINPWTDSWSHLLVRPEPTP